MLLLIGCAEPEVELVRTHTGADSESDSGSDSGGEPEGDPPGTVLTVERFGSWTRAEIEPWLDEGVHLDNGYQVLGVTYVTAAGTASATVTLPYDLTADPPAAGFPIVVNAHGTVGLDDPCQLTGTLSGTGLAALFGGRGAIGVAPDYPGLGTEGFHHYLDAYDEATSILDAIRAAVLVARDEGVATSGRSAVVGLSQGGHATLATAALHSRYAPELDIRAFGASGPASVYLEQWQAGVAVPGEHLVMHAMLAWSFTEARGADRSGIWAPDLADTVDEHLSTRCYWDPDFEDVPLLSDDFPTDPGAVFSADYLEEYSTGAWDRFAAVGEGFDDNRIRPWLDEGEQTAPIAIWQGSADTTVPAWMTEQMVADLQEGGVQVDLHLVAGGTHTTTAFGFLASHELATDESVAWIQERLAAGP